MALKTFEEYANDSTRESKLCYYWAEFSIDKEEQWISSS